MSAPNVADERAASFECCALPCLDAVYRFARSLTHDAPDADDLVQETFLRALRSWHTFRPDADCRRWLFAICHNAFVAGRSSRAARAASDAGEGDVDSLPSVLSHRDAVHDGTDELLSRIGLAPALAVAIAGLVEPFRAVVQLIDGEGQSYQEAAALLGVPIGTVRSRLFRGRRVLQESLFSHACDAGLARAPAAPPRAAAPLVRRLSTHHPDTRGQVQP